LGYTTLVYFLSAQPLESRRFFMFSGMGLLVSFVAQSVGQMVGAGFSVEVNLIINYLVQNHIYKLFLNLGDKN